MRGHFNSGVVSELQWFKKNSAGADVVKRTKVILAKTFGIKTKYG